MPKKLTIPVVAMLLLLTVAPLVLAQEDADQTQQPTQEEPPTTTPEPAQQSTTPPAAGAPQSSPSDLSNLMHLDPDNNRLIVNCPLVSETLEQANQLDETQRTDPQVQSAIAQLNELAQLCAQGGFTPSSTGGSTTPTPPPADGGSTTPTPSTDETSNDSNSNATG